MNISSSSSESRPNLSKNRRDDKHYKYKRKTKLKDFILITNNLIQNYKTCILNLKELLKKIISNINTNINSNKLNENIDYITKKIEILFTKYINEIKNSYNSQYENILKLYEQKIRYLYENKFNLELNRKILEESNKNLLRKEKEYELIKEKTGIVVINNKIINNDRKENEIFILRKENSLLKDTLEKQKKEIEKYKDSLKNNNLSNSRSHKGSKEKTKYFNPKLIIKSREISKFKNRLKTQSLSLGPNHYRKIHYSHPKSLYPFKLDFLSSLNNSISKSKNNLILSSHSYKNYFSDFAKKLFNTSTKKKSKSKPYLSNLVNNIKVQKMNEIKKLSPLNLLKKGKIPNKRKKNISSILIKDKKFSNNKKRINNSSICIKATKRDTSNTNHTYNNYTSHSKKKNNSECITEKNLTNSNALLFPSVMKTINNEKNKNNQILCHKKCLSPSYGNLKFLKSGVVNGLNMENKEIKSSKSFTRNNYNKNNLVKKKGIETKKLFLNKVDNCNTSNNNKIINLVFKRGVKNISQNNRLSNSNKNIKIINSKMKGNYILNNIKTINNTNNNSKIKLKILKK